MYLEKKPVAYSDSKPRPHLQKQHITQAVQELQFASTQFGIMQYQKENVDLLTCSSDIKLGYCLEGLALTFLHLGHLQYQYEVSQKVRCFFESCEDALESAFKAFRELHDHDGMYVCA